MKIVLHLALVLGLEIVVIIGRCRLTLEFRVRGSRFSNGNSKGRFHPFQSAAPRHDGSYVNRAPVRARVSGKVEAISRGRVVLLRTGECPLLSDDLRHSKHHGLKPLRLPEGGSGLVTRQHRHGHPRRASLPQLLEGRLQEGAAYPALQEPMRSQCDCACTGFRAETAPPLCLSRNRTTLTWLPPVSLPPASPRPACPCPGPPAPTGA